MKLSYFCLLFISFSIYGQTDALKDEKEIYEQIVHSLIEPDKPFMNETIPRFQEYDIDGNFEKWFYDKIPSTFAVSVEPLKYENNVVDYLISIRKDFNIDILFEQVENQKTDYLKKYLTTDNIISFKRAPLKNSTLGNLFKRKEAYGLSNIIYEPKSNLALVKIFHYTKNKKVNSNSSQIVILEKIENNWSIIKTLNTKIRIY